MSWIKLDDQWMDHPKIIKAGRDARDVWLASITWCAKHLTDGYFPIELLPSLAVVAGVDVANCQSFAKTLLDVGLWEGRDGEYYIHDYLIYNPTKEQTEANREARSEAGRAGGLAKASKTPSKTLANVKQNSAPSPSPSPSFNESTRDDKFSEIQRDLEEITGLTTNPSGIEAINQIIAMSATREDIQKGYDWIRSQNKVVKYYGSLVGPTRTAMSKRVGESHGNERKRKLTGPDGEVIYV